MERALYTSWAELALLVFPTFWLGLLVGVSFVATPVKFSAESLTLPVALDVGRATFRFFNNVEWIAFGALVVAVILSGPLAFPSAITALLGTILLAQTVWLLPTLDGRIAAIIAGQTVTHSIDHFIYIGLDVSKAAFLLLIIRAQIVALLGGSTS